MLNSLPEETLTRWQAFLEPVHRAEGAVMQQLEEPIHWVYFPLQAIIGQFFGNSPDESLAVVLIGSEGLVGVAGVLDRRPSRFEAMVVRGGDLLRLDVERLRREMERDSAVRQLVLAYVQTQIEQIAEAAISCRFDQIDQVLCRRLLQLSAGERQGKLDITQELLSRVVGSRRGQVNRVVADLQSQGIVESGRGWLRVIDRPRLALRASSDHERSTPWFPTARRPCFDTQRKPTGLECSGHALLAALSPKRPQDLLRTHRP